MEAICKKTKCGFLKHAHNRSLNWVVSGHQNSMDFLVPTFKKYELYGDKRQDFIATNMVE